MMQMPEGTLYSNYSPFVFNDLCIKDDNPKTGCPDFSCSSLIGAVENNGDSNFTINCEKMEFGESMPVDFEFSGREGLFDEDMLYAIYEKDDVIKLIKRLEKTLN